MNKFKDNFEKKNESLDIEDWFNALTIMIMKKLLLLFMGLFTCYAGNALYYAEFIEKSAVVDNPDCCIIRYAIWNDQGTPDMTDDTKVYEGTTTTGGCFTDGKEEQHLEQSHSRAMSKESCFSVCPNPIFPGDDRVQIVNSSSEDLTKMLVMHQDGLFKKTFDLSQRSDLTISTLHWPNGQYSLIAFDTHNRPCSSRKLVILR